MSTSTVLSRRAFVITMIDGLLGARGHRLSFTPDDDQRGSPFNPPKIGFNPPTTEFGGYIA